MAKLQTLKNEKHAAVNLLQQLTLMSKPQNLVYSPFCLLNIVALFLNVPDPKAFGQLLNTDLLTQTQPTTATIDSAPTSSSLHDEYIYPLTENQPSLQIANALFLNPHYQSTTAIQRLLSLNQIKSFELSEQAIDEANDWMSSLTHDELSDLVNYIDADRLAILISAVSFHGKWPAHFFTDEKIEYDIFYGNQASYVAVMQQHDIRHYYEDDQLQATRINYQDDHYQLLILLPKAEQVDALDLLITQLTATYLDHINSRIDKPTDNIIYQGSLYLPRFTVHYETDQLIEQSQTLFGVALGHDLRSQQGAPMTPPHTTLDTKQHPLLDLLIHKATLSVTEQHTDKNSPATATNTTEHPIVIPFIMQVDHPFLFAIQNKQGRLLLAGTVREIDNVPRPHHLQ